MGGGGCELQEGEGVGGEGWLVGGAAAGEIAGGRGGGERRRTLWSGVAGAWGGAGHRRP